MCSPRAHRISGVWSRRIRSPRCSAWRSYGCSPGPPAHTGKAGPSPPGISHNTGRPRSASDPRPLISSPSGYRAGYRGPWRPRRRYSGHRSWPPDRSPSPGAGA